MTTHPINEDTVEQATITWLNELDYIRHGPDIADDLSSKKMKSLRQLMTHKRNWSLNAKIFFQH